MTLKWPSRYCLFILLSTALGGCANFTRTLPPIGNWDEHQTQLSHLQTWRLQGKLGLRLPESANSVNVSWQQDPDSYAIRLSGPFGQGTTWIRGNQQTSGKANSGKQVHLEQAGRTTLSANTPEELIYTALGWHLPIQNLYYWIRGIPAPEDPITAQEKTAHGALAYLEQSGWQLSYSRYNNLGPWQLPEKIVATREQLKLTLIIKQWQVDSGD